MDRITIEYSFKPNGKFNMTEKKTWSNRYSSFIDWQKCDTASWDSYWGGGKYYCNGKLFFENEYDLVNGAYKFIWYDLNKEPWYTFERGSGKDFQNTHRWVSNKCIARDGYYSDWETTLYHQYNT